MNEHENEGSEGSGSLEDLIENVPSANASGQTSDTNNANGAPVGYVSREQYEQLERKLGEQGSELGSAREYVEIVEPILEKIRSNDALFDIISGDILTPEMAQAILDGKVTIGEAKQITSANEEVKKELGKKEYDKRTPEEIEALIIQKAEEKFDEASKRLEAKLDNREEEKQFTDGIAAFIKNTPDYIDFADDVNQFFKDHPQQDDIEVAYRAVKTDKLQSILEGRNGTEAAAYAKQLAMNASEGDVRGGTISSKSGAFEDFVSTSVNPNA